MNHALPPPPLVAARARRVSALAAAALTRFRWRELTREDP